MVRYGGEKHASYKSLHHSQGVDDERTTQGNCPLILNSLCVKLMCAKIKPQDHEIESFKRVARRVGWGDKLE